MGAAPTQAEIRERVARAIHDSVTGCPELWNELDEAERDGWRLNADDALAVLPAAQALRAPDA